MATPPTPPDILVVEDDPAFRDLLCEYLRAMGYAVYAAKDGRAATYQLMNTAPSLIITDIHMPQMDGLELLVQLRETCPGIPIIAMSGRGLFDWEVTLKPALLLGARQVLVKPFPLQGLYLSVREAIGLPKSL